MPDATFDGPNLIVQIPGVGTFDVERDFYSAWKEWARQGDHAKYPPAFDTTGGDDIGGGQEIAPYFFLRNDSGWRIRTPEADGEVVVQGNLFPRVSGLPVFMPAGGFDAFVRQEVSTRAVLVTVSTGSGLSQAERDHLLGIPTDPATEVWNYTGGEQ